MSRAGAGNLVELRGLTVDLHGRDGTVRVLQGIDLEVSPGEAVGMVGESGSGKSMTARTIARLLPRGATVGGEVRFDGSAVYEMSAAELRALRVDDLAIIHQDPRASIDPLHTIGDYLTEVQTRVKGVDRGEALAAAERALGDLGVPEPERRLRQYPHQLSGGLLQRVTIAAALTAGPRLLIADEPTTGLDVTTQEEVVAILTERRKMTESPLALLFITHDLDLAAAITDRLVVMYAGVVVECGPTEALASSPLHPYTAALLDSRPTLERVDRLRTIPGRPQSAAEVGPGCAFAARCPFARDRCRGERPRPRPLGDGLVACHFAEELQARLREPSEARP